MGVRERRTTPSAASRGDHHAVHRSMLSLANDGGGVRSGDAAQQFRDDPAGFRARVARVRAQVAGDVRDEETAAARDGGARERLDDVALPVATRRPFTRKPSLASLRTSAQKVVCFDANDGTRRRSGGGRTAARASDARAVREGKTRRRARRDELRYKVIWNAHRSTLHTCDVPNPRTRKARRVSCAANHNTARPRLRKAPSTPSKPLPSLLRPWQWRRRFAARPLRWRARAWRAAPAPPPRKSAESRRQERVSVIRAYGDRRRNDDAPRGGGGWTNEFGDEYDAIDDDDGYFEERRAPAGRPDRGRAPDRGRRFDDDRRRGGFGRAEVGDLRRRGEGGRDGGRRNDRRRDDDGDWVEVRPNDGSAREETRCARPHGGRFHL